MRRERVVELERITARRLVAAVLVGLSIFAGCGQSQEIQEPSAFQPLVAHEDLLIDGYDADFVPIYVIAVSPDERIFVRQWQDYSVRVFDADGADLGRIGRQGEGPGEFSRVNDLGFVHDTLWVADGRLGRISLFSPSLDLVRTESQSLRVGGATLEYGSEVIEFRSGQVGALLPNSARHALWGGPTVPAGSSTNRLTESDGGSKGTNST